MGRIIRTTAIIGLLVGLAACGAQAPLGSGTPSPKPAVREILYRTPDGVVHRASIVDGKTSATPIKTHGRDLFRGSPDGRWVVWTSRILAGGYTLWIAPAADLDNASELATSEVGFLGDVVWSPGSDEVHFFVAAAQRMDTREPPVVHVLRSVRVEGKELRTVATVERAAGRQLEFAGVTADGIYWLETGEGGYLGNLTVAHQDGAVRELGFPEPWVLEIELLDGAAAWIGANGSIVYRDLETGDRRILASPGQGKRFDRLDVAPDGTLTVLEAGTDTAGARIFSLDPATGTTDELHADAADAYLGPTSWSPDGRYLLLDTACYCGEGETDRRALLDTETGEAQPYLTNARLEYLSWLAY